MLPYNRMYISCITNYIKKVSPGVDKTNNILYCCPEVIQMVSKPETKLVCQGGSWAPNKVDCKCPHQFGRGTKVVLQGISYLLCYTFFKTVSHGVN